MSYDSLVHAIYESALHPEQWPITLQRIRQALEASAYSLFALDAGPLDPPAICWDNLSEEWTHAYKDYWWQHDSWFNTAVEQDLVKGGMTLMGSALVDHRSLRRSHWFNDGLVKQDIGDALCTGLWGTAADMPPWILSFYRTPQAEPFQPEQQQALASLNGHLQRALAMTRQMGLSLEDQALSAALLEGLEHPVLLLDGQGRLLRGNSAAQRLPNQQPQWLRIQHGRLLGLGDRCCPDLSSALAQAQQGSIVHVAFSYRQIDGLNGTAQGQLAPLPIPVGVGLKAPEAAYVLMIRTDRDPHPDALTAFGDLYQLTPTELNVLAALMQDDTPETIAQHLQVSITTVRSHLLSLRRKTDTPRLSSLIRLATRATQ